MANNKPDYSGVWVAQPSFIAAYLALSLAAYLGATLWLWCRHDILDWCGPHSPERLAALKLLAYSFCFGGMGATTYSIHGLYQHVAAGDFDHSYFYWYLFRGPLGAVLGMIAYLLMQGGVLVFSDGNLDKAVGSPPTTFKSKAAIASLAFLAGFSTNQFTYKLQELARTLFGEGKHSSKKGDQKFKDGAPSLRRDNDA